MLPAAVKRGLPRREPRVKCTFLPRHYGTQGQNAAWERMDFPAISSDVYQEDGSSHAAAGAAVADLGLDGMTRRLVALRRREQGMADAQGAARGVDLSILRSRQRAEIQEIATEKLELKQAAKSTYGVKLSRHIHGMIARNAAELTQLRLQQLALGRELGEGARYHILPCFHADHPLEKFSENRVRNLVEGWEDFTFGPLARSLRFASSWRRPPD